MAVSARLAIVLSLSVVAAGGCSGSASDTGSDASTDTDQNPADVADRPDIGTTPTPDAGADLTVVDTATDVAGDTAPDVAPDTAPDVAPDAGVDAAPDAPDDRPPVTVCMPGLTGLREAVPTTPEPVGVALADFDLDGNLDVAVATSRTIDPLSTRSLLDVLYGAGGGVFGRRTELSISQIHSAIIAADFNRDGAPDLAVTTTGAHGVEVLFNSGGTFSGSVTVSGSTDMLPKALIARDLDGDGRLDLAWTGSSTTGALAVAKGAGGSFGTPMLYLPGSVGTGVAAGDLNEDGIPDLVVTDQSGATVRTLLGQGGLQFGAPQASGSFGTPVGIDVADFDEDRHLDVVVLTAGGPRLLRGKGDGTYFSATGVIGAAGANMIVTDLDRDGHIDIAVLSGSTANTVGISRGRGDGTFLPVLVVQAGQTAFAGAAADLTGDTRPDLVVANIWNSMLTVLPGTASGFVQPLHWKTSAANFSELAVVDLDRDGNLDVVTGKGEKIAGAPNGELASLQGAGFTAAGDGHFVVVDWTGDGRPDVVADGGGESVRIYAATAAGGFAAPVTLATTGAARLRSSGDFDGDGHPDLVLIDTDLNGFVILYGDGQGGVAASKRLPSGEASHSPGWGLPEPTVVDIDKDGVSDVMIRYVFGLTVARGARDRSFSALPQIAASYPTVAVRDIDGDGRLDLIMVDQLAVPGHALVMLRGAGDGRFDEVSRLALDPIPPDVAIADVDGDRTADLVMSFGSRLEIWNMNGLQAPTRRTVYPYGASLMRVADLDGDGTADVFLARPETGEILRMRADCR